MTSFKNYLNQEIKEGDIVIYTKYNKIIIDAMLRHSDNNIIKELKELFDTNYRSAAYFQRFDINNCINLFKAIITLYNKEDWNNDKQCPICGQKVGKDEKIIDGLQCGNPNCIIGFHNTFKTEQLTDKHRFIDLLLKELEWKMQNIKCSVDMQNEEFYGFIDALSDAIYIHDEKAKNE